MPIEQADNTRVERRIIEPTRPVPPEVQELLRQRRMLEALQQNQAQLWDADKVKRYQNMQNFYNNNFFGYGIAGRQTTMILELHKDKLLSKLISIMQKEMLKGL